MKEFKRCCYTCVHSYEVTYGYPCTKCGDHYDKWEVYSWMIEWLNSFDISSAAECLEAVNTLKEQLERSMDNNADSN